jgi:hypothetical protein
VNTIGRARQAASKLIAQHIDPAAEQQTRKAILHTNSVNTFDALGREWCSEKITDKRQTYQDETWSLLAKDPFPPLGRQVINTTDATILLETLCRI